MKRSVFVAVAFVGLAEMSTQAQPGNFDPKHPPKDVEKLQHGGALASGDDQAVAGVQLIGRANLDRARTWELVKAFVDDDVEWIFLDTGVQRMLRDYALSHGEDKEYVNRVL